MDATNTFVTHLPALLGDDFPGRQLGATPPFQLALQQQQQQQQHAGNNNHHNIHHNNHHTTTNHHHGGLCIVSPDAGGVARAKRFRNRCENMYGGRAGWTPAGLAIIVKHRYKPNEVAAMDLVGDVKGRVCVLVDDMTDTCGTLLKAAGMLRDQGAVAVYACIAHGVLSGPACARLEKDRALKRLCVLDTIGTVEGCRGRCGGKLAVLSAAPILATAIDAIASRTSLSSAVEMSPAMAPGDERRQVGSGAVEARPVAAHAKL